MMKWFLAHYVGNQPATATNPYAFPYKRNLAKLPPATIITADVDPLRSVAGTLRVPSASWEILGYGTLRVPATLSTNGPLEHSREFLMPESSIEVATLGGGCFWCTESVFLEVRGVSNVVSGYAGGHVENPTYQQICGKQTGHAEVVNVTFEPSIISYRDILMIFFGTHDPTTPNQQGNDKGPQYRSVIFTHSDEQAATAKEIIAELTEQDVYGKPIVTEVAAAPTFYEAEAYHQNYYANNPAQPYCTFVVSEKVAKVRQKFANMLK